jgi:hypothetical protein
LCAFARVIAPVLRPLYVRVRVRARVRLVHVFECVLSCASACRAMCVCVARRLRTLRFVTPCPCSTRDSQDTVRTHSHSRILTLPSILSWPYNRHHPLNNQSAHLEATFSFHALPLVHQYKIIRKLPEYINKKLVKNEQRGNY